MNLNHCFEYKEFMSKCPNCGSKKIEQHDGENFCTSCGISMGFDNPEVEDPKDFHGNQKRKFHEAGSSISKKDFRNKPITKFQKDIRKTHSKTQTSTDRNLKIALEFCENLIHKLNLSSTIHTDAINLYVEAHNKKVRGKSIKLMVTACIYAIIRHSPDTTKSLNEIETVSNFNKKKIQGCYRLLHQVLELKPGLPDPQQKLAKIGNSLGLSPTKTEIIKRTASKILQKARDAGTTAGKDPNGIAAAAVYLSCVQHNESVTQRTIGVAANVTEVTIRNRIKDLKKFVGSSK